MTHIGSKFRQLHKPGDAFVMVNVWDRGSAKMMAGLGAPALATSSAALAYVRGLPDGGTLTRDDHLAHAADIVSATALPVQGDFENGFGDDPDTCAETVRLAAEVGLAGICIEDIMFPTGDAYDFELSVARIRAASAAARALPQDFVLTARADGIMTGQYDMAETIRRVAAFDKAGADCLYAPAPPDMAALAQITAATSKPVNALVAGHFAKYARTEFSAIGVARISIGAAMARVTHQAIHDAGAAMISTGDFSILQTGMGGDAVDAFLA